MGFIHFILDHLVARHISGIPNPGRIQFFQFRDQDIAYIIIPVFIDGIPYHNARMTAVAPYPIRIFLPDLFIPSVILPVEPFILKHQSVFIRQIVPEIRNYAHAYPHGIPVELFRIVDQEFLYPVLIPYQVAAVRIFKKPLKCDIGPPEKILLPVQVKEFPLPGKITHSKVTGSPDRFYDYPV